MSGNSTWAYENKTPNQTFLFSHTKYEYKKLFFRHKINSKFFTSIIDTDVDTHEVTISSQGCQYPTYLKSIGYRTEQKGQLNIYILSWKKENVISLHLLESTAVFEIIWGEVLG